MDRTGRARWQTPPTQDGAKFRERKKPAQNRYPTNADSIGVEVVGAPKGKEYGNPTAAQDHSSRWLVTALISTLKVDRTRIFAHGAIDPRKLPTEGINVKH